MLSFEPFVNGCTEQLIEKLDSLADGRSVDLAWWLHAYAFDVVGELSMGRNFGLLSSGKDEIGVLSTLGHLLQRTSIVGQITPAHGLLRKAWFVKLGTKLAGHGNNDFRAWTQEVIGKRLKEAESDSDRPDM